MRRLVAVATLALAVVGGACDSGGSGGVDDRVATINGDGVGDRKTEPASEQDQEQARLAFARCMRQNGVDMPDPTGDGTVMIRPGDDGVTPEVMEKAEQACRSEREAMQGSTSEAPADLPDKMTAMARCLRSKGIDMPDPQVGGNGRPRFRMESGGSNPTPDDPEFQEAMETCREEVDLPEPSEGGPAPGGNS